MNGKKRLLNRLSGKFVAGAVCILLLALAGTWMANSCIAKRYYQYQQKKYVSRVSGQLIKELEAGASAEQAVREIEEREKVLIAYSEEWGHPDLLAEELREKFRQKGLGFQKYWLWDQDYETVMEQGSQFRLYHQDRMNYSILVQYLSADSGLYAVAAIVPDAEDFLELVNHISFLVYGAAMLMAILLIAVLTRHITNPLSEICEFTRRISFRDYQKLEIKTGDELEEVADSLNEMAGEIERYQEKLEEKNEQMKQLIHDVAHDLKTPVSLVGMYAAGM